ncbi:MAG TPA: hypothetical protein VFU49_20620 [Ktedonobacteraceae bacterium]|nr:hypothetical protein [Ktedonobacteraceae bacterium]
MQNDPQLGHPGEEHHYNPDPQFATTQNFGPGSQGDKLSGKRRNGWKVATMILLITNLVFLATTVFAFNRANSVAQTPTLAATQTVQPTPVNTANPPSTPTSVAPSPTPTSVDTSGVTPTTPGSVPVANGTIQKNIVLTCSNSCNDPIRVTINTIQIDGANGRMIWDITLKNITGNDIGYGVNEWDLQADAAQTKIPATFSQRNGTLASNVPLDIQAIFAFVPSQNVTYTLTAELGTSIGVSIAFDPVKITF